MNTKIVSNDLDDFSVISFEKLPSAVFRIYEKLQVIENLLSERASKPVSDAIDLMVIDEAADFLRLSKQRLYTLVSERKIPFMKKTKRLYFSRQSLKRWLLESERRIAA